MRYLTSFTLAAMLSSGAVAATCPDVASITQKEDTEKESVNDQVTEFEGYRYTAKNADGEWTGFTPYAQKADLGTFKPAPSAPNETPPVCRYEDGRGGTITLSFPD